MKQSAMSNNQLWDALNHFKSQIENNIEIFFVYFVLELNKAALIIKQLMSHFYFVQKSVVMAGHVMNMDNVPIVSKSQVFSSATT